ncbi:MAG: aromatic ring-hydroxylating dioxygenase subunit alpha [Alphaproteobacteria bacterium]|nr:aromatic ring-hydroxylating dioxygenase subunit alpha [Alphaproteobacteria bacterium]
MHARVLPLKELPGRAYWDDAYAQAERDTVLARNWVHVASGFELPEPGDALPISHAGKPVLLVRQADGTIRGFHNVCRHRGCQLVTAPQSRRALLSCPFHLWAYRLDGRLHKTPFWDPADRTAPEGFDPARFGLMPVATATWCDQVFVRLADDGPSFAEHIAPLARRWQPYELSLARYGGHATYEIRANWKLVIQNFLDTLHLPFLHPQLGDVEKAKHYVDVNEDDTVIGIHYLSGAVDKPKGDGAMPIFPNLPPALMRGQDIVVLYPNTMLEIVPGHILIFRIEPVAPALTREVISAYFVGDGATDPAFASARKDLLAAWDTLNRQDFAVVTAWQAAQVSPAAENQPEVSPVWEMSGAAFRGRIAREVRAREVGAR